jgi:hypothetical protein
MLPQLSSASPSRRKVKFEEEDLIENNRPNNIYLTEIWNDEESNPAALSYKAYGISLIHFDHSPLIKLTFTEPIF